MSEHINIHLTLSQMRQLARYERTFKDLLPERILDAIMTGLMGDEDGSCYAYEASEEIEAEAYQMTMADLTAALHNMQAADPTVGDLHRYWFAPIDEMEDLFGLDHAQGLDEHHSDSWTGLVLETVRESTDFADIWYDLQEICEYHEQGDHLSAVIDFAGVYQDLARHAANRQLPVEEWIFSTQEMERCLHPFEDNDAMAAELTDEERDLARMMIEELAASDSTLALHIKGYACYGGNALYARDWPASRDCITRLYELTGAPTYANTLGYIYYYGRCTNGVPEYDKAFHYYEIAAANGLLEGLYKLADMYWHGYGCEKSPATAANLYRMVYESSLRQFLAGESANFADAALRMGNVYAQGIQVAVQPEYAYYYYLQADYAARLRAQESDFFGNTTVVINAQKALDAAKHDLPAGYCKEFTYLGALGLLYALCDDRYRCVLEFTQKDSDVWELHASRIRTRNCRKPDAILVTMPEIGLCERTTEVTITAVGVEEIWFLDDTGVIRYDAIEYSEEDETYSFYYDDLLTAMVKCDSFRIYRRHEEAPHGPEYRMVSICFHPGGRSYDYICDLEDVQVGDTVIVNGYDGETAVEVVAVRTVRESELGLPVERYKKVVRKA